MTHAGFFHDLLHSIFKRSIKLPRLSWLEGEEAEQSLKSLTEAVLQTKGEASALVYAERFHKLYEETGTDERNSFFKLLAENYDLEPQAVINAAREYLEERSPANFSSLIEVAEPPRQELFRRLNSVAYGTVRLVRMREALLKEAKTNQALNRVDLDLCHMFRSWFNRGFLVLRAINWTTPAHILEKIIAYEAVHEIPSWDELRLRLEPEDRRCFAFFHPSMQDEPLIFVEVALGQDVPAKIADVLAPDREIQDPDKAKSAIFYSISNCQKGLKGISFGNFLIKQVANDLQNHFPHLEEFATLSPMPGFINWLRHKSGERWDENAAELLQHLVNHDWPGDADLAEHLKPGILRLAAQYLLKSDRPDGSPNDPVARFHLENGATLDRVNWLGDVSNKGLTQAAGLMVNYRYDLARLEHNHEIYAAEKKILASSSVKALLKE